MTDMQLFELVNPSDPYTFYAENLAIAGTVAQLLSPMYGAVNVNDSDESTPVLFGWEEFNSEHGINADFVNANKQKLHDAFDSFLIGSVSERKELDFALSKMTDEAKTSYLAERQERQRTSLNTIGENAFKLRDYFKDLNREAQNG